MITATALSGKTAAIIVGIAGAAGGLNMRVMALTPSSATAGEANDVALDSSDPQRIQVVVDVPTSAADALPDADVARAPQAPVATTTQPAVQAAPSTTVAPNSTPATVLAPVTTASGAPTGGDDDDHEYEDHDEHENLEDDHHEDDHNEDRDDEHEHEHEHDDDDD